MTKEPTDCGVRPLSIVVENETLAVIARSCYSLLVAPRHGLDVNAIIPAGEHMRRKLRPLAALALIAVVALISACGTNAPAGQRWRQQHGRQ